MNFEAWKGHLLPQSHDFIRVDHLVHGGDPQSEAFGLAHEPAIKGVAAVLGVLPENSSTMLSLTTGMSLRAMMTSRIARAG